MPITEIQREERKKYLGSSDCAAVMGLDPYRSPMDVYLDKTNQIQASGFDANNDAIDVGNFLEEGVLNWFGTKYGMRLILNDAQNSNRRLHENGIMAANFDAFVDGDPTQAVEAKTHAVISNFISEEWGEVETDEVPERIALQCQHQMAIVPSIKTIWVPVLLGGVGLRRYRIERNDEIISNLEEVETNFWKKNVQALVPPEGSIPSIESIKKLKRIPNKTVTISTNFVEDFLAAKEVAKQAEDILEEKKLLLLAALGDAESGISQLGEITYFLRERKAYQVSAGSYRQLQFKKSKGESHVRGKSA